ncbi:putative invertase inhibitor [Ziziphus jujuba]|uniref:Invertase inhibitor n=2 Tax=Ziziphus jujuba TaxID=326968 RepID=A0A6P4ARV9_ZIZJJ|nr:putative invertase inhibitor [Ziziphus jujuba]KAH7517043.1 hypothetical protein FEM48_Zijuj09G0019900 [Ziziphus jujuba var. spinosa]
MKPVIISLFLSSLCFLSCSSQSVFANESNATGTNLIETACQHAGQRDLCVTTLEADPNTHDADMLGLALIALRLASSNASDISEHAKLLFKDTTLEPTIQDGYGECLDHYLDAAEQLDDSIAALLTKAYKDVEVWVKVAISDADQCESALKGKEPAMVEKNQIFRQLCNNVLAIVKVLAEK